MRISESIAVMGLWNIGEGKFHRKLSAKEGKGLIKSAYRLGIRDFSSAYSYGDADSILSSAMKELRASDWKISTKVMPVPALRRKTETILKRLGRDHVDVLMLHWPAEDESLYRSLKELEKLKDEKVTEDIGVSNFPLPLLRRCSSDFEIRYHERPLSLIWNRDWNEEKTLGIRTLAYAPLGMGILSGKYHSPEDFQDDRRSVSAVGADSLTKLLGTLSGPEEALSWVCHERPYAIISGFSSPGDLPILGKVEELNEKRAEMLTELADAVSSSFSRDNIFSHDWRHNARTT